MATLPASFAANPAGACWATSTPPSCGGSTGRPASQGRPPAIEASGCPFRSGRAEACPGLLRFRERRGRFDVDVAASVRPGSHQVVLAVGGRPPDDEELGPLERHLRAGGGLVLAGSALAAWSRSARFAELAGWAPGELSPASELRLQPTPGGQISDRIGPELRLRDSIYLGEPPPPLAVPLLSVPWHYGQRGVVFSQPVGAGCCLFFGLGIEPESWAEPVLHRLLYRSLRVAAGLHPAPPAGVGLYGFGAIWREHGQSATAVEGLELRGVCDRSPPRRDEASRLFDVPTHANAAGMLADPDVELVVVGVPPVLHARAVLECLAAGKHVVCEKPFALRVEEVERMLAAADEAGRTLTVYQSRRWDPDFVALRRAVASGALGVPFYMVAVIGGFGQPCSYRHSHESISCGTIYDCGS